MTLIPVSQEPQGAGLSKMKILFNDLIQHSSTPKEIKSPALAECFVIVKRSFI